MTAHTHHSIGIGCSSGATSEDIVRLVRATINAIPPDTLLATIDRRSPMGETVAAALGLRLMTFPASTLVGIIGTTTHSALALTTALTANVAEASALAALGKAAELVIPQRKGHLCTCAVARLTGKVQP